ncbi:hypothetical protein IQ03_04480 [Gemmobacter caeni]|uniref:Uncharacterized protein n=1 Tax=Gemmobacter caeni TaxID=589035 RepID=A0A2T6AP08_9RHOB|nr:hypothetical protein [Gemmobacter caeni]PTX45572.1 hypothetical protein C8N34_1211 [Gemmobacter caeni]TWI93720.1 hypothetical protein IQ03_04480 [Gemmobacter caeni]
MPILTIFPVVADGLPLFDLCALQLLIRRGDLQALTAPGGFGEEDKRSEAKARSESLQQLSDIMADWTKALSVEAEKRMQMVDGERRVHLETRLRLARSMLGDLDPLSFIEQWVSPEERYQRKFMDE